MFVVLDVRAFCRVGPVFDWVAFLFVEPCFVFASEEATTQSL